MNQINHVKMNKQIISAGSPIGSITAYGGTVAPIGWHNCDGSSALLEDYPDFIQWAVENDAIGEGKLLEHVDGSDTFNFPDMRETVLVGCGHNGTHVFDSTETVPGTATLGTQNHDEYTIGQFKDDQQQRISGDFNVGANYNGARAHGVFKERDNHDNDNACSFDGHRTTEYTFDSSRVVRTGYDSTGQLIGSDVTHGKQMGINYIIRVQ